MKSLVIAMDEQHIKALEAQIESLEQEIFESNRIIAWLQKERMEAEQRYSDELKKIYSSSSWMITRPARAIFGAFRRMRGK